MWENENSAKVREILLCSQGHLAAWFLHLRIGQQEVLLRNGITEWIYIGWVTGNEQIHQCTLTRSYITLMISEQLGQVATSSPFSRSSCGSTYVKISLRMVLHFIPWLSQTGHHTDKGRDTSLFLHHTQSLQSQPHHGTRPYCLLAQGQPYF